MRIQLPYLLLALAIAGGLTAGLSALLAADPPPYSRAAWQFDSEAARAALGCPRGYEVDHVVALEAANASGGASWPPALKRAFARDPSNWSCVPRSLNRSKGARTLAE